MAKKLIVIVGPTAIGKTALAIELAKKYQTEIISADSRQFYHEMSIGTAKPTLEELAQAKHHFIGSHSIEDKFNVGDFEVQGLATLEQIFKTSDLAILVGGSGLYIDAICRGFDQLPQASDDLRKQLNLEFTEKGIAHLQQQLKQLDPVYFEQVDIYNPQRIIRALEVCLTTGMPFSGYRMSEQKMRPFESVKIGLTMSREMLYQRINQRVELMIDMGLEDEVRSLLPYRHLNALNTVGYSELFMYFDGKISLDEAIEKIKQNTRRFAKRQLTWFRKDPTIRWFEPGSSAGIDDLRTDSVE